MAETVGSLVDKLSICGLKIYHMETQILRKDAPAPHVEACKQKLAVLQEQQTDLSHELSDLISDVVKGKKTMKVYRQFKMYNDPTYRVGKAS